MIFSRLATQLPRNPLAESAGYLHYCVASLIILHHLKEVRRQTLLMKMARDMR